MKDNSGSLVFPNLDLLTQVVIRKGFSRDTLELSSERKVHIIEEMGAEAEGLLLASWGGNYYKYVVERWKRKKTEWFMYYKESWNWRQGEEQPDLRG